MPVTTAMDGESSSLETLYHKGGEGGLEANWRTTSHSGCLFGVGVLGLVSGTGRYDDGMQLYKYWGSNSREQCRWMETPTKNRSRANSSVVNCRREKSKR